VTGERSASSPAPLFRRHRRRPRLTSVLDATKAQAILLTAPAGFGKTTLAREWLQNREHVAWYRATSASADLAAFSTGLADVIGPIVPGAGERLRQRLRVGDMPEKATRPLAELLAEDLSAWPEDGMIVIDDYHLVADSAPVEEFVDWLLTLVPVRILVTTRRRPSWASARRVLYGEIMEIGPERLAMNDEEAGRVLEGRSSESVRTLVRQARGWPALIGLAALSVSLELPEERVSDALFRYFAEEVLRREPPEVQRFMLLASVPPTVNGAVARNVLGFEDPEPILERLRAEDLIQETQPGELSFHPLLRDFLRKRLQTLDGREFLARSYSAFVQARAERRWDDALALALEIGRPDLASAVVGEGAGQLLAAGHVETVEKWLEECGSAAFNESGAVLARGQLALRRGHFSEAAALTDDLLQRLPEDDDHLFGAWHLIGQAAVLLSDYERALSCHLEARRLARSQSDEMAALWGAFVSASELDRAEASDLLVDLQRAATEDATGRLRVASGRIIAATHAGSFGGLWPSLEPLLPLAESGAEPMAASNFLANAACVSVGRGDYETARRISEHAVQLCRELRLEFAIGFCLYQLAAAHIGLKQFREAERTLHELTTVAFTHEDPWLQALTSVLRIKLGLGRGSPHEALPAVNLSPDPDLPKPALGEYLGACAMALAAAGHVGDARAAADRSTAETRTIEAKFFSSYASFLCQLQGARSSQASSTGRTLLLDSRRADYFDTLVLAYRSSSDFLDWLVQDRASDRMVVQVMSRANDLDLARRFGLRLDDFGFDPLAGLTVREREVLALLGQGHSNAEIAEALVVTQSTVKVHVHHIFRKLQVKTRLQAVLKARALLPED
jgi:LuxR family maltose regulon positive regulatory protein